MTEHIPVLLNEVISLFEPKPGDVLLDTTVGLGGHAMAWLESTKPNGRVIGMDADAKALTTAKKRLERYGDRFQPIHGNFANLKDLLTGGEILQEMKFSHVLFDLGIGSHQISDIERGFSFSASDSLSMAFGDLDHLPPAEVSSLNDLENKIGRLPDVLDILSNLASEQLTEIIQHYGEEKYARRIAKGIKEAEELPSTAVGLADLIKRTVPTGYERKRIHPATRTFQALRLSVNRELESLATALPQAVSLLPKGGLIGCISFHSLEDRIVKHYFRDQAIKCKCPSEFPVCVCNQKPALEIITKKLVRAGSEEVQNNPRARSAKLRIARKIIN